MSEDLENAVHEFLGTIPKKRYTTVREILLGVNGGKYPTAGKEKIVKDLMLTMWEHHLVDEKPTRQPGYRIRQEAGMNFAARTSLKAQYKKDVIALLKKNGGWMRRVAVAEEIAGPAKKHRDARRYIANRVIGLGIKQGTIERKQGKLHAKIRLAE